MYMFITYAPGLGQLVYHVIHYGILKHSKLVHWMYEQPCAPMSETGVIMCIYV